MSVYKCKAKELWGSTDWECFGPAHSTALALVTLMVPCFLAFSLVVSSVFLDRSYTSDSITARAHGRVGIAMISLKTGLTLLFTVMTGVNPWFLHITIVVLGAGWLYLWLRFLPSYTQWMNAVWSAFGAIFLWAAMCGALAKLLDDPKGGVGGLVFFLGIPIVAFAGHSLAHQRFHAYGAVGAHVGDSISSQHASSDGSGSHAVVHLKSPWDVELRARYLLREIMREAQKEGHHGTGGGGGEGHGHGHGHGKHKAGHGAHRFLQSPGADGGDNSAHVAVGDGSGGGSGGSVGESPHLALVDSSLDGGEAAAKQRAAVIRARAIADTAALFEEASHVFPGSPLLDLMRANFIRCFMDDPAAEMGVLTAGLTKEPAMDVRFLLLQARVQCEDALRRVQEVAAQEDMLHDTDEDAGVLGQAGPAATAAAAESATAGMGIIERVQFDKLMSESIEHSLRARVGELRFWAELRTAKPDAAGLHHYSEDMSASIVKATRAFDKLVAMAPANVDVLQTYAVFLLEVRRDSKQANAFFDRADRVVAKVAAAEEIRRSTAKAARAQVAAEWNRQQGFAQAVADAAAAGGGGGGASPEVSGKQSLVRINSLAVPFDVGAHAAALLQKAPSFGGAKSLLDDADAGKRLPSVRSMQLGAIAPPSPVAASTPDPLAASFGAPGAAHAPVQLKSRVAATMMTSRLTRAGSKVGASAFEVSASAGASAPLARADSQRSLRSAASWRSDATKAEDDDGMGALRGKNRRNSIAMASYAAKAAQQRRLSLGSTPGGLDSVRSAAGGGGQPGSRRNSVSSLPTSVRSRNGALSPGGFDVGSPCGTGGANGAAGTAGTTTSGGRRLSDGAFTPVQLRGPPPESRAGLSRPGQPEPLNLSSSSSATRKPTTAGTGVGASSRNLSQPRRNLSSSGEIDPDVDSPPGATQPHVDNKAAVASAHAREKARQRRADRHEAAAHSLRSHLSHKAAVMEPSLVLLARALTALFVLAGLFNIVEAAVGKTSADSAASMLTQARDSKERQLYLERVIHSTHDLLLMSAGVLPFTNESSASVLGGLRSNGERLAELHRSLLMAASGSDSLPQESEHYTSDSLLERTAVVNDGSWLLSVNSQLSSFSSLAAHVASKAQQLSMKPLRNITANQPDAWHILANGPGVVRAAAAQSTLLLDDRIMAHMHRMGWFAYLCALVAAVGFGAVGILVVTPLVLRVKAHTDEIFLVFLALPDGILADMQYACAGQIDQLRALFDDPDTFSAMTGGIDLGRYMRSRGHHGPAEAGGSRGGDSTGASSEADVEEGRLVLLQAEQQPQPAPAPVWARPSSGSTRNLALLQSGSPAKRVALASPGLSDAGSVGFTAGVATTTTTTSAATAAGALRRAQFAQSRGVTPSTRALAFAADAPAGGSAAAASGSAELDRAALAASVAKVLRGQATARTPGAGLAMLGASSRSLRNLGESLLSPKGASAAAGSATSSVGGPSIRTLHSGSSAAGSSAASASASASGGSAVYNILASPTAKSIRRLFSGDRDVTAPPHAVEPARGPARITSHAADKELESHDPTVVLTQRRLHQSFMRTQVKLLARFAWPLLAILVFYGAAYWYTTSVLYDVDMLSDAARMFGLVHVGLLGINNDIRQALSAGATPTLAHATVSGVVAPPPLRSLPLSRGAWNASVPWAGSGCNATLLQRQFVDVTAEVADLREQQDDAMYGAQDGGRASLLQMVPAMTTLMLEDACGHVPGQPADCNGKKAGALGVGFYNGLLNDGLQAAMGQTLRHLAAVAQVRLRDVQLAAAAGAPCPPVDFSSPGGAVALQDALAHTYVTNALHAAHTALLGEQLARVTSFQAGLVAMAVCEVAVLAFLYVSVLLRSIRRMDGDMKRTRGTMLLFPPDVLAAVAEFMGTSGLDVAVDLADDPDDEEEDEDGEEGYEGGSADGSASGGLLR